MTDNAITAMENAPIIAAPRSAEAFGEACASSVRLLFLLHATISDVAAQVHAAKASDVRKFVFLHADLIEGLSADSAGMRFLRSQTEADGIISTRSSVIRAARECGFFTVQRFFVVDSQAEETVYRTVMQTNPDCIELMPGLITPVAGRIAHRLSQPVIAGGLIETKEQVIALLSSGVCGVSTSSPALWNL